jgi:quinol monooxygenase YgiN
MTTTSTPTTIIIAGRVFLPPQQVRDYLADAQALYPIGDANPGARLISFGLDDEAAGIVTILEHFDSQEAQDRHFSHPDVVAFLTKWSPQMRNEVLKFDAVNERSAVEA